MNADVLHFEYEFVFEEEQGDRVRFVIDLDPETLVHARRLGDELPDWTLRDETLCGQCTACASGTHCPLAISIAEVAAAFSEHLSYTRVELKVTTPQRTYSATTTLQRGLSSLLGLYMATSGCPVMAPFKAMARFHMPLATREETVFRVVGAYLIGQYLRVRAGGEADLRLAGLQEVYAKVHTVNKALANRIRDFGTGDANLNALVVLDLLAHDLPHTIEAGLGEMQHLYRHLLDDDAGPTP